MSELSVIARQMRVFSERKFHGRNLGFPEQVALMCVAGGGKINQEQVAQALGIDKGAVAKTLSKLEEKGLIERELNSENRREKIICLTENAEGIIEEMKDVLEEWHRSVYEGISQSEIKNFESTVKKMVQNSEKMIKEKI